MVKATKNISWAIPLRVKMETMIPFLICEPFTQVLSDWFEIDTEAWLSHGAVTEGFRLRFLNTLHAVNALADKGLYLAEMSAGGIAIERGPHMDRVFFSNMGRCPFISEKVPEAVAQQEAVATRSGTGRCLEMLGGHKDSSKWPLPQRLSRLWRVPEKLDEKPLQRHSSTFQKQCVDATRDAVALMFLKVLHPVAEGDEQE